MDSNIYDGSIVSNDMTNISIKLFDDIYYSEYREHNEYIEKELLFGSLTTDLLDYINLNLNLNPNLLLENEVRIGYILYTKMSLSSSKMNNIFNLFVQKTNPNIRIQSYWEIISSFKGPMESSKGLEILDFDRVKIKIIIKANNKDIAIQKLSDINLHHISRSNKKIQEYLVNYLK